jgi:GNAT superfamily N-acetyltransferase
MQSGSNLGSPKRLIFERATDAGVLSGFSCGIDSMDNFIHNELQDYIWMGSCQMYVVREEEEVVAMFCLDNHNLCLSETVKEKMHEGLKPAPQNAPAPDSPYWLRPFFDAVEITYLAVSFDRQHQHIGSFIIERIIDKLAHDQDVHCDFVTVRALKHDDYTAVPFYLNCGFYPAEKEVEGRNLFMYRVVVR